MKIKKKNIVLIIAVLFVFICIWTVWGNITIKTTYFSISDKNIPTSFDGYKIAQISDLHNAEFGDENSDIIEILKNEKPDIIVFTGDLIDSNHTDIDIAMDFLEKAIKIAPCYFVTGNHEYWLGNVYDEVEKRLKECGVNVLRNKQIKLERNGGYIQLIGVDDPNFTTRSMTETLSEFPMNEYTVLLSHRPEIFDTYVESGVDLVLSGHAHGGQFRLPFVGGLVAPDYGFFPEYDSGKYIKNNTTMIVSRGVGNSIIPVRFNNRPEVVIVKFKCE